VLVIIDDLDKLDLSITETIFSKNIKTLLDPTFRILYTIPFSTLRDAKIKALLLARSKRFTRCRGKVFSKATVRQSDRVLMRHDGDL
jgi:hypothetical protein